MRWEGLELGRTGEERARKSRTCQRRPSPPTRRPSEVPAPTFLRFQFPYDSESVRMFFKNTTKPSRPSSARLVSPWRAASSSPAGARASLQRFCSSPTSGRARPGLSLATSTTRRTSTRGTRPRYCELGTVVVVEKRKRQKKSEAGGPQSLVEDSPTLLSAPPKIRPSVFSNSTVHMASLRAA